MIPAPVASFSNRVELLYARLKKSLFGLSPSPFAKRIVVVPSSAMKSWLMLQMAADPELGIAAGIEVFYLDQAIQKLTDLFDPSPKYFPSNLELALAIEKELRSQIREYPHSHQSGWKSLMQYLQVQNHPNIPLLSERRLPALSHLLASLFIKYGIYGAEMLEEWNDEGSMGWQQQLWQTLFGSKSKSGQWSYPYQNLVSLTNLAPFQPPRIDFQIHIFALSFLPKLYYNFLNTLSRSIQLNYYLLSPCQAFWSDIVSDRERIRIQAYWQDKNVSIQQQKELENYLRNRNPLLANFGRLGREMAMRIQDSCLQTTENYMLPDTVEKAYEDELPADIELYNSRHPLTMLEAIQADMAVLRNPEESKKIVVSEQDNSIQLHVATSRMREIQILYNTLLQLIDHHAINSQPIHPHEILVMAPDINAYAPYIKFVFGARNSQLEAHVMDLSTPLQSQIVQGFRQLIALSSARWDAEEILQLFDHPLFQRKHGFNGEDLRHIRSWVQAADVRWGTDSQHRNQLLRRDYGGRGMTENSSEGTWENAIERLLDGLAYKENNEESNSRKTLNIDATQGILLGKWIGLLRALHNNLQCLNDGSCKTIEEWARFLSDLCINHFASETSEETTYLTAQFDAFTRAGHVLDNPLVPFSTIQFHLEKAWSSPAMTFQETSLHAVRFCSLLPMRAIPAKIIAMIGMEDGAYPRASMVSSLDLMKGNTKADYCPSQIDYDRFLFLEALLSARNYLLMSYVGYASEDGKEQLPSLLATELLSYLDKSYEQGGKPPSQQCIRRHPFYSFDCSYFLPDTKVRNYSNKDYLAAKAYNRIEKAPLNSFISTLKEEAVKPVSTRIINIHLKELLAFARNPIKTYFNKTLGIYLNNVEKRALKRDEDFLLSSLQHHFLQQDALRKPTEKLILSAEETGKLPFGAFKSASANKLRFDIESIKSNLAELGVLPENIFAIEFSDSCSPAREIPAYAFPQLRIAYQGQQIHLSGIMPDVTSHGLAVCIKDDPIDIIKVWPQFLIFCCLIHEHGLSIPPHLLICKGAKARIKESFFTDPHQLLQQYLDYYFTAMQHPSLLIPEWVHYLVHLDASTIANEIKKSMTNPFQPFYNEYVKWMMRDTVWPDANDLTHYWQPRSQQLFGGIYEHWYKA